MTTRDDTKIERFSILSKLVTILLFLLAQVVAALLIGSVALAVSPAQAAEVQGAAFIKPGDAWSGALLLKNGTILMLMRPGSASTSPCQARGNTRGESDSLTRDWMAKPSILLTRGCD
jgi:hypothetical protein